MRRSPLVTLLMLASAAHAQDPGSPPPANPLGNSSDFLSYHPDLGDRKMGMDAYKDGNFDRAAECFRWAARYADKPSQAMLGSMYWDGKGLPQDHALAYAWMDLAAERGYPSLLAYRERYWQEMSEDEQKRAVDVGQSLYAEFGDAVAKPRLEAMLRRGQRQVTGSRTGFVGTMEIHIPRASGDDDIIDANQYYDPRYWKPKQYWAWADKAWKAPPQGKVNVGTLEVLPSAKSAPKAASPDDANRDPGSH